eukprot:423537_1
MDDTELNKLCEIFASYIISHVDDEMIEINQGEKNKYTHLKIIGINNKKDEEKEKKIDINSLSSNASEFIRSESNMNLKDGVNKSQFMKHFLLRDKQNWGIKAWKEIHFNDNNSILTRKELSRWLLQYLRKLIYLRETLDSYHSILSNMQHAAA